MANSDWSVVKGGESDLLVSGQVVIAGLKNTTGRGHPECGEAFGRAHATFDAVETALKSAIPANGWDGAGAYGYADQNTRQQMRSAAMADADREVHKVLSREAAQITLRRGHLDDQCNFLAGASVATGPLQSIPRYGEAMKLGIEIAALQTALSESCRQLNQLHAEVTQNAADLQQAVGRYSSVADGAELPGIAWSCDPNSDRLQAGVATTLDSDNPPGPPAGMPLQDGK